jgi:hypothetical protein
MINILISNMLINIFNILIIKYLTKYILMVVRCYLDYRNIRLVIVIRIIKRIVRITIIIIIVVVVIRIKININNLILNNN